MPSEIVPAAQIPGRRGTALSRRRFDPQYLPGPAAHLHLHRAAADRTVVHGHIIALRGVDGDQRSLAAGRTFDLNFDEPVHRGK